MHLVYTNILLYYDHYDHRQLKVEFEIIQLGITRWPAQSVYEHIFIINLIRRNK